MSKSLYVLENGNWNRCENVLLIIHGLSMSSSDEELDFEWGCMITGQLLQNTDFKEVEGLEYKFGKSNDPKSGSKNIALHIQSLGMGSYIIPEVTSLIHPYKMVIGIGYSTNKSDLKSILISNEDIKYLLNHVKVE